MADVSEERLIQAKEGLAAKGITDVYYQTIDITSRENVASLARKASQLGTLKGLNIQEAYPIYGGF